MVARRLTSLHLDGLDCSPEKDLANQTLTRDDIRATVNKSILSQMNLPNRISEDGYRIDSHYGI